MGLADKAAREAEKHYDDKEGRSSAGRANYPDWIYGRVRTRPLLVVHLLAIGRAGEPLLERDPVAAWSISFPATTKEEKRVEYVVNTTWHREHYPDEDSDEDAGDDE